MTETELKPFEEKIIKAWKSKEDPSRFANANVSPKSRWIMGYLLDVSEAYVGEMFAAWKRFVSLARESGAKIRMGGPRSFTQYLWLLRKLKLIQLSRSEPSRTKSTILRNFYKLNRNRLDDPSWERPLQVLYPKSDSKLRKRKRE